MSDAFPWDPNGRGDKIVRRKLSDQVLERMQDLILSGEFGPGEMLPSEHELMDRFGVGRPAVREALQSLQTMGLITISHGERSRVNELTPEAVLRQGDAVARMLLTSAPENLEDLKQARWLFEIGMVRVGAPRATPEDVAELRRLIEAQRASSAIRRPSSAPTSPSMSHLSPRLCRAIPAILSAVSQAMLGWLFRFHSDLLIWSGHEDITLAEHAGIVDAIEARDPEAAAAAMDAHLKRSNPLYQHRR